MKKIDSPDSRIERRLHPRFRISDGVFAVLKNHEVKVGPVFDLSRGGVSFRYIADKENENEADRIDLFAPREQIFLEKLPVRTICDFQVGDDIPFSTVPVRHRCLQFLTVEPRHKRQLEILLHYHAKTGTT